MRSVLFVAMLITLLAGAGVAGAQSANWVQLSTAHSPSGRYYPAMAYDPVSRLLLLFGGMTASGTVNDTWLFDGSDWTQVQTPTHRVRATEPPCSSTASSRRWYFSAGQTVRTLSFPTHGCGMGHRAHGRRPCLRIIPRRFSGRRHSRIPAEATSRSLEVNSVLAEM
jgi:hypothetical protein